MGQMFFGKKNAKNVMKNHILKPPRFTLIMLLSIQPVKNPEKIAVFLIILVESSIFSVGRAKMPKKGFNPMKNIFTHRYFSVLSASLIKYDQ